MQATNRAVFQELGCSACTPKAMVENQGIDTLDELCFLKDGDVEILCKNGKCLGGPAGVNNRSTNDGAAQNATQPGTPAPANASTNSETMINCNHPALTHQQA